MPQKMDKIEKRYRAGRLVLLVTAVVMVSGVAALVKKELPAMRRYMRIERM